MSRFSETTILFAVLACAFDLVSHTASAQQLTQGAAPQVVVSGSAEVLIPPSNASFSIGIVTSGQTSAAAAQENARISKAVLEALERAGLTHEEIKGSRLQVSPHWEYDDKGQHPKRTAFDATNSIQVATDNLPQVGTYIDVALSSGATNASEIAFSAKDVAEARRRALSQAVAAARADGETIAHAGGGELGDVQLLSTEKINDVPGVAMEEIVVSASRAGGRSVNSDVIPSQIKVSATVIARWRFVSTATAK